jgi:hypothetical protein
MVWFAWVADGSTWSISIGSAALATDDIKS